MSLKKSYIALAWTRPVPWAGFASLSTDIDVAAGQSRTIRYQRDRSLTPLACLPGTVKHLYVKRIRSRIAGADGISSSQAGQQRPVSQLFSC